MPPPPPPPQRAIRDHYNSVTDASSHAFAAPFKNLRAYHNLWKRAVIAVVTQPAVGAQPCARILDVCCGKGGDINKWTAVMPPGTRTQVVGVDIADHAIGEARRRWSVRQTNHQGKFDHIDMRFEVLDVSHPQWAADVASMFGLRPGDRFLHAAVAMFCINYFEDVGAFTTRLASLMRPGGSRVGIIFMDATKLDRLPDSSIQHHRDTPNKYTFTLGEFVDLPEFRVDPARLDAAMAAVGAFPVPNTTVRRPEDHSALTPYEIRVTSAYTARVYEFV